MLYLITLPILLLISALYASVGLGGGTAYLAILSFWTQEPDVLRPIAWFLNIICAAVGFFNFYRHGHFIRCSTLFLCGGGIVGAILGAKIHLTLWVFRWLLASILLIAAVGLWIDRERMEGEHTRGTCPPLPTLGLGFAVGLLSGAVGIGGGVLIGPMIILMHWMSVKQTAATTSLFILLSSAAALVTFLIEGGTVYPDQLALFGAAVLIGGYIGSHFGAGKASSKVLKIIFAAVACSAAFKLLIAS